MIDFWEPLRVLNGGLLFTVAGSLLVTGLVVGLTAVMIIAFSVIANRINRAGSLMTNSD